MDTTQKFLPVKDILNDLVILKDGSVSCVIKTSAVNFGLLSENEQLAIISSFAGLLNSLSFSIQIVVRSKRMDISSYLGILDKAKQKQNNPLLKQMIGRYRQFIESVIRENEVLDKQFYVVISVSYLELGVINDIQKHFSKAMTIIGPRRDNVIRQLERIGLKASQLNTEALIKLFYDIFNGDDLQTDIQLPETQQPQEAVLKQNPAQPEIPAQIPKPAPEAIKTPEIQPLAQPNASLQPPTPKPAQIPKPIEPNLTAAGQKPEPAPVVSLKENMQPLSQQPAEDQKRGVGRIPFVVEELPDEYSSI